MEQDHKHVRWDCPYFDNNPEHYGYETVVWKHTGGYEWRAVGVFRRLADNSLFSYIGGGCSCNGPNDDLPQDLEALTPQRLDSFFADVFNIDRYDPSGPEKVAIVRDVMEAIR